jgi:hypothetical protein
MKNFTDTSEFYSLTEQFEKAYKHLRLDKENRELWPKQRFYQSGETNAIFLAFLHGYQVGRLEYMH